MSRDRDLDEDEGQRPRHALPGVKQFGPEDVNSDEAAAFGAVGAGSKMRRMIDHHRRLFPAADRAMLRRKWDEPRSEALQDHAEALADELGIDNLEGVGVRGENVRARIITLVTRGETGRTHKSWLPYSILDGDSDGLAAIKTSCERAATVAEARRKGMVVGVNSTAGSSPDDMAALQAENASLARRLAKLEKNATEPADGEQADDLPSTIEEVKAAIDACDDDEEREALKVRIRENEQERDKPRQGVLDATEPADE